MMSDAAPIVGSVTFEPVPPSTRHVWVLGHGHAPGSPAPGVIVSWQHQPVHIVTQAEWVALVAHSLHDDALLVSWVGSERLRAIRDDTRTETVQEKRSQPVRHVWVNYGPDLWSPALLLAWRQGADGGWEARVASVGHGSLDESWRLVTAVRPVTDDRQA